MSSAARQRLGIPHGAYMERRQPRQGRLERFCAAATGPILRQVRMRQLRLQRLVRTVAAHDSTLQRLGAHEMREMAAELRCRLRRQGFAMDVVAQGLLGPHVH